MHRNIVALNKLPLRQENDSFSKYIIKCISVLLRPKQLHANPQNKIPVSETHLLNFFVDKTFFPGIVKMDLRNGITWNVLMGYEWNLVLKTPCDSEPVRRCLTPSDPWMTLKRQFGVMARKLHEKQDYFCKVAYSEAQLLEKKIGHHTNNWGEL